MEKDNGLPPRPTIVNVLGRDPEPLPEWLANDNPPRFNCDNFFGSRTVYYPGYGDDGQPVELCNRSHAAHTFIYVDHGVGQDTLVWCLTNTLTNLRVLLAVGCVALPRVVTALGRPQVAPTSHRALPTTKMPSQLHKRICETPH